VDTGSGSVVLEYAGGAIDDLNVDTGSGRVDLRLPDAADLRMSIETGSGGINVQRSGGFLERRDHDSIELRFGSGRGRVVIDTGSGGVTIR